MHDLFYYKDAYIQAFDANILDTGTDDQGFYVVLDNTAFYPEGGGQPADIGTLNDVRVIDVQKIDGEIRHYVDAELSGMVHGQLDWAVRFDHMQQHAGQHILTAAFVELFDYQTVSFHLGSGTITIDLDTEHVTPAQLQQAEDRANEIVLENRPIETKWVTAEEAASYPLRKQLKFTDDVRLVIIPDFDYNGCGGTHPRTTGEVAMIKILSTERQKKQTRVHFMCGERLRENMTMRKDVMAQAAKLVSRPESEIATGIEGLLETNKKLEKQLAQAREQLLDIEIAQLAATDDIVIATTFDDYSMQQLQKIARTLTNEHTDKTVALVSADGTKTQIVIAKGKETGVAKSANDVLKQVLTAINGKGGGNDSFAQGGGDTTVSTTELLANICAQLH